MVQAKKKRKTFKYLKEYKKIKDTCEYCKEITSKGLWCNKKNIKCSYHNCIKLANTHPLTSCGNKKEKLGYHKHKVNDLRGLSKNETLVLKYREQKPPLSYGAISKRMRLSKSYVFKLHKKVEGYLNKVEVNDKPIRCTNDKPKVNDSCFDFRLHNDDVAFDIEPISFWFEKTVKLKYCEYLSKNNSTHHLRIFPNGRLLIRFKKDILGKSAIEVKKKADDRIKNFLSSFKMRGVKFIYNDGRYTQTQREYAILGVDFAKKLIREKKKFFVFDKDDGLCRAEVDFSKERPEFENPHPKKCDGDAVTSEAFFGALLDGNCDLPDVTKSKLDSLIAASEIFARHSVSYAENIKKHMSVMNKISETLELQQKVLKKMEKKL